MTTIHLEPLIPTCWITSMSTPSPENSSEVTIISALKSRQKSTTRCKRLTLIAKLRCFYYRIVKWLTPRKAWNKLKTLSVSIKDVKWDGMTSHKIRLSTPVRLRNLMFNRKNRRIRMIWPVIFVRKFLRLKKMNLLWGVISAIKVNVNFVLLTITPSETRENLMI